MEDLYAKCNHSCERSANDNDFEQLSPLSKSPSSSNKNHDLFSIVLFIYTFLGPILILVVLGILKGIIGLCCCPVIGMYGLGLLVQLPRPLDRYQERELRQFSVQYDELGWPVHPCTQRRTVRAMSKKSEFFLNIIFFLAFPLALCCKICGSCCTTTRYVEEVQLDMKETSSREVCSDVHQFIPDDREKKIENVQSNKSKIYYDSDATETSDTKYVLEQLKKSEQCLKNCNYLDNT